MPPVCWNICEKLRDTPKAEVPCVGSHLQSKKEGRGTVENYFIDS